MEPRTDLVARAQRADADAWDEIYRDVYPRLLGPGSFNQGPSDNSGPGNATDDSDRVDNSGPGNVDDGGGDDGADDSSGSGSGGSGEDSSGSDSRGSGSGGSGGGHSGPG